MIRLSQPSEAMHLVALQVVDLTLAEMWVSRRKVGRCYLANIVKGILRCVGLYCFLMNAQCSSATVLQVPHDAVSLSHTSGTMDILILFLRQAIFKSPRHPLLLLLNSMGAGKSLMIKSLPNREEK